MNFDIRSDDGVANVIIKEKIFSSVLDHDELKKKIDEFINGGHIIFRFDMQSVDFIDSTGIGQLLALHKRLAEMGGKLTIFNLQPRIHKVFKLMEMENILIE